MHNSFIAFIRSLDNLILFLYMVSDCIIISSVALLVLSIRKGRIPGGIYLTFFAGGFYSIIDLLCSYDYFYDLYVPNSIIDSGYILSFLLIAYGALLVLKEKNESQVKKFYCEFENSGTSKKSFLLLTFPIIFIIFKGFQYTELILLILTYMFYKILSIYVQNVIKNEKLLIKEKNMNLILEEKINERTKELILTFPEDGDTRNILIKNADIAMYNSKSKGYNKYSFFNSYMNDIILEKHEIEMLLRNADYNKEFQLHYQPQINLENDQLVGVEALIRWNSPIKGNVRPDKFIKIAEEIGVIEEISDWVMKEASRQIYEWNTKYGLDLKMGINISPKQLGDINFVNKIKYIIDTYKLEPKWLDIEITENIAMRGEKILEKIFASLNDLSISTSIDDFGTGYSSLSYIQQFSFNRLKIAKELIDKISTDCSNNHIVEAIVVMSKSLKVATIAEGVENYEQVNILKDIGCDEIQGYVFSKPLPAKELEYNFSSVAAKFILFTTMTLWFVIQFFMDMNLILMELQLNFYDKDKYYLKILCIMKPVVSDNIF